jgi:hypothetical protein
MVRVRYILLGALAALLLPAGHATAGMADYMFTVTSGSTLSPSWTDIFAGGFPGARAYFAGRTATVTLPFAFRFNNVPYTQISLSTHGLIAFGTSVSPSPLNDLGGVTGPVLAPFWDALYIPGDAYIPGCVNAPAIRVGTSGSAPNRVFVIDYKKISREECDDCQYGPMFMDFQVRLYEGTQVVEFNYENASAEWPTCVQSRWGSGTTTTSASIGMASSGTDFLSITPNGSAASASRLVATNMVNLAEEEITAGTTYRFTPCFANYTGNVAQGGTSTMASGDVLLSSMSVERGASASYQPFTITLDRGAACASRTMTYRLSGAAASDYTIVPSGLMPLVPGVPITFNVTFTPTTIGPRPATLTISDPIVGVRTYTLRATATPRITWTPDLSQGATPGLASGDTLLKDILVKRRVPRDFTPITFRNISTNPTSAPAVLTFALDSAGRVPTQYRLVTPPTVALANGQSHTPIIRFIGESVGEQHATLTINADGEIRTFPLKAFSAAPGIMITALGAPVSPDEALFRETYSCVGVDAMVIPLTVRNPGRLPVTVSSIEIYGTDSAYRQGVPTFALLRDAKGAVVRLTDYVITDQPGIMPMSANTPASVPFTLQPGESRALYATFIGQLPGRRLGRVLIRTDAENWYGTDTTLGGEPNSVIGLLTFDVVGQATGSQLAATADGMTLRPIVFPHTRVGDSALVSFSIANSGACDLRINRSRLRIVSGDVNEFTMLTSLRHATFDATTGDFILAPGMVDTIAIRFRPSRSGTRMATLLIRTNDSTIGRQGMSERGVYYLDLSGRGKAGLDARDLVLAPVVIGGSVGGVVVLENTQTTAVSVTSIGFMGGDAAQFSEDATTAWPSRPFSVLPGAKLQLGVRLTPSGDAGVRATTLVIVTASGDSINIGVRGEAGTRTMVVSPTSLFDNATVNVGLSRREQLMITNTGTLPIRIVSIELGGADSAMYRIGSLPRRDLDPGQTEYLEVTFSPTASGRTSATLVVTASNTQRYSVMLGGTALRARRDAIDGTTGAPHHGPPGWLGSGRRGRPTLR